MDNPKSREEYRTNQNLEFRLLPVLFGQSERFSKYTPGVYRGPRVQFSGSAVRPISLVSTDIHGLIVDCELKFLGMG